MLPVHYYKATKIVNKQEQTIYLVDTHCFLYCINKWFIGIIEENDITTVYDYVCNDDFYSPVSFNRYDGFYEDVHVTFGGSIVINLDLCDRESLLLQIIASFPNYEQKMLNTIPLSLNLNLDLDSKESEGSDSDSEFNLYNKLGLSMDTFDVIMDRYLHSNLQENKLFQTLKKRTNIINEINDAGSSIIVLANKCSELKEHVNKLININKELENKSQTLVGIIDSLDKHNKDLSGTVQKLETEKLTLKQTMKTALGDVIDKF